MATGELKLFQDIWDSLEQKKRRSFVSGDPLFCFDPYNYHHVLTKQTYPSFRLYVPNIVLLTHDEHNKAHGTAKSDLEKCHPGWIRYFELYSQLKQLYYAIQKGGPLLQGAPATLTEMLQFMPDFHHPTHSSLDLSPWQH